MAKGQKAQVTLPALSTTTAATVIGLPTAANSAPGNAAAAATTAVTFPVQLSLDTSPATVLPGMSAQIVIALASHENVLAVPTWDRKVRVLAVWLASAFYGRDIVSLASVQHPRAAFTTDAPQATPAKEEQVG